MNEVVENTKIIYNAILDITLKMKELINLKEFDELSLLIEKKNILFNEIAKIKNSNVFSDQEKSEINEIIKKVKEVEDNNISELEAFKKIISDELSALNKNAKVLSAYKTPKEVKPKLFDSKE